jgi:hypothetical protein
MLAQSTAGAPAPGGGLLSDARVATTGHRSVLDSRGARRARQILGTKIPRRFVAIRVLSLPSDRAPAEAPGAPRALPAARTERQIANVRYVQPDRRDAHAADAFPRQAAALAAR